MIHVSIYILEEYLCCIVIVNKYFKPLFFFFSDGWSYSAKLIGTKTRQANQVHVHRTLALLSAYNVVFLILMIKKTSRNGILE